MNVDIDRLRMTYVKIFAIPCPFQQFQPVLKLWTDFLEKLKTLGYTKQLKNVSKSQSLLWCALSNIVSVANHCCQYQSSDWL